jgi:hypothetical protein
MDDNNSINSFKNDIDKYSAIWEKALKDGIFDSAEVNTNKNDGNPVDEPNDFFGLHCDVVDIPLNESEGRNWNAIYRASVNEVVNEEKSSVKKKLGNVAKSVANAFNPVQAQTVGKDATSDVDGDEADLEKLSKMKVSLHDLKSRINSKEARADKRFPAMEKKLADMEKEIDALSDSLYGNRTVEKKRKIK